MENIYHLLTDSLSADSNLRIKAELNLKEAEKLPEYPIWLASILVSEQGEMGTRQSAGIQLKTWVNTYWSSSANKEVNLEPSQEVKQQVKQLIIQGLSSADSKIRTTSAFAVARVAHYDWPEQWPDFLEGIVGFLTSGSTEVVVGSLQVLTEFSSNDLTEQRITAVVPVVFPQLFNVLSNPQIYSPQTRANAITVFGNMMEVLHIVKESDPNLESELVLPLCSDWIQTFLQILSGNPTNANELVLMLPVFKCLGSLIPKFPNLIKSQILQIIQLSIQLLNKSQQVYTEEYIYTDSCELPNIDSDPTVAELSEIPKLESMLYTLFDILISVVYKKGENGQSILTGNGEILDSLVWALIPYLQISKEQSDIWAEDPNKFVADEDDQTFNYSVRVAAQDVFMALESKFAIKTVEALSKSVPSYVQLADQAKQSGNPDWWTILEACLVSIGLFSQKLTETFKQNNGQGLPIDISSLFESIVLPLMAVHDAPYAQGRAFIFTSQFASILPSDLCNKCITETLQAAKNSQSTTVRISCLKSLHNFSRFLDNELVAPYQKDILESTFHLVEFNKSDVLILILEIWLSVIQINSKVTGDFEEMMTPKVMEIWVQFSTDPIISALVFDIIEELAKIEAIYSNLVVRVLPGLKQVMSAQVEDAVVIASAIDVLTSVVRGGPSPLPAGMVNEVLPTLVNYFGSDDHSILQNIQDCLKNLIYKDPHQFAQWSNASGQNGFEVVLNFIFSVLQPGRYESEALFAGDVIVIMMIQAGDAMTNYIPSILNSVVNRLQSANTETFCQSLLMVVCHVLRFQMHDGLSFLAGMDVGGVNGLELVLRSWLEHHDSFSGYYAIKLSAYVLSKLFLLNDARLKSITVQGDLINPNPNRILTRSQTRAAGKQYTQIPAMTKILSLLIDDLNNNTLDNQQQTEFGSEKDLEDEWEDVDDEEGMFLSDMLDYGLGDFDENDLLDDELFKSDELYNLNMNEYLKEFFQSGIKQNLADFHQFAQGLNGGQQEFLQSL